MPDQKLSALTAAGILTGEEQLYVVQNGNSRKVALSEVLEVSSALSENRIINGAFDFWQRGTSTSTFGVYIADRWRNEGVGGTGTMSRQAFAVGDTLGNNNPAFFLRQSVSGQTLASHLAIIQQRIEGVRSYAGQTITLLGWARRSSGAGNTVVEFSQSFGTGGSPSADVQATSQTITLTGSWSPFAITVALPSITGKTIGTNGGDYLGINFWTSAGSDFNARTNSLGLQTIGVDLWGIHIRLGTHTTAACAAYRAPELGPELARCQRYFCKSYSLNTEVGAVTNSGAVQIWTGYPTTLNNFYGSVSVIFPVNMRAAPSVEIYNPFLSNTQGSFRAQNQNANLSAVSQDASTGGVVLRINNQNVIASDALRGHYTADAEL